MAVDIRYLAGYLDGEGCFAVSLHKHGAHKKCPRYYSQITCGATDKSVLSLLKERFGGSIAYKIRPSKKHKNIWEWKVCAYPAAKAANELLPYLKLKTKQAEIVAEVGYIGKTANYDRRVLGSRLYARSRSYNKRGKPQSR